MKIDQSLVYLFVFLLLNITIIVKCNSFNKNSLNVTNSIQIINNITSLYKNVQVLDTTVEMLTLDVETDRELYIQTAVGCANYTCQPVTGDDCSCDYASKSRCGLPVSTNTAACPPSNCPTTYPGMSGTSIKLCDSLNWTTIVTNKQYIFNFTSSLKLRLKVNATACKGYKFVAYQIQGLYSMKITNPMNGAYRVIGDGQYTKSQTATTITTCPTDQVAGDQVYTTSTYIISFLPSIPASTTTNTGDPTIYFQFIVYEDDIPNAISTSSNPFVSDGGYLRFTFSTLIYYRITQPVTLTISCPRLNLNDVIVYITDSSKGVSSSNYKWVLSKSFESVTLNLTPANGNLKLLQFLSNSPSSIPYTICVTSSMPIHRKRVMDLPMLGATYALANTVTSMSNTTVVAYGLAIYPRQRINPLWPLPISLLGGSQTKIDYFFNVDYQELDNPFKNNSVQACVILSILDDYYTSYNQLSNIINSNVTIGNGLLVDIDGNGLDITINYPTPTSPMISNITDCDYGAFKSLVVNVSKLQDAMAESDLTFVLTNQFSIDLIMQRDEWLACKAQARAMSVITLVNSTSLTTVCRYQPSTPAYISDNCCNQANSDPCIPYNQTSIVESFAIGDPDLIGNTCASFDCTYGVLTNYFTALTGISSGDCSIDTNSLLMYSSSLHNLEISCNNYVYNSPCALSINCATNGTCTPNPSTGTSVCTYPTAQQNSLFIKCMMNGAPVLAVSQILSLSGLNPGTPINATTINIISKTFLTNGTFDKSVFTSAIYATYDTRAADMWRSLSLCRVGRVKDTLASIACSCSGPGGSSCYSSTSYPLGETKPCVGEYSSFDFPYGTIQFSNDSEPYDCGNVLVSQVSRSPFKTPKTTTLSSSFATYQFYPYSVYNSQSPPAVIGEVLSDGVRLKLTGISYYRVCLGGPDVKYSSRFPVFDLAMAIGANDTFVGVLAPMEVQTEIFINDNGDKWVCAYLTANTLESPTYFAIHREDGWASSKYHAFDKVSTGLIYGLAVIFILCATWGMAQLIYVGYDIIQYQSQPFKLVHGLIFSVTLFITIRGVYFFVLPTGKLESTTVSDYILVVLPTFVYFTAFTIISVLWYTIISAKARGNDFHRRIAMMIGGINGVLYILFIVVVLVFQFSTKTPPISNCGGFSTPSDVINPMQRTVSWVYAIFQAIVSLVIGTAFIHLGYKIHKMMGIGSKSPTQANSSRRIYIVTWTSSIGFILHCVFVIVLVAAQLSNMIFSFIGLVITEVLPAITILYAYNQINYPRPVQPNQPSNFNNPNSPTTPMKRIGRKQKHSSSQESSLSSASSSANASSISTATTPTSS